jgi:uncharacterized protein (TIGR02301 family)
MNGTRSAVLGCLAVAMSVAAVPASAAPKAGPAEKPAADAPPAPEAPRPSTAPFMKPLGRLATILGSVHFLRALCGDENAAVWRDRMNDLIRIQSPNDADREILIASFNSGYRSFASVYRRCTPAAREAVARYQEEGAALGRDIAARYGN